VCVAEGDDVVLLVEEDVEQTWSLVWSEVTVEVTGTSDDGQPWVVRANGICERERVPPWGAATHARLSHPGRGRSHTPTAPMALRLREAIVRGYSVLPDARTAG
jgi:hypothetical protein